MKNKNSQNSPWFKSIFLLPGNCKDYENEFLQKENIIWDQWHCLLHGKLQVPYWKLFSLSTQTNIFSASLRMWLSRRKAFFRHCSPRSISFKDTSIVRNFYPKKFHPWCKSKKLSKDLPPTWWEFNLYMITSDYFIEGCTTCSQVYHSDCSVTAEPTNQLLLIIFTPSKVRKLI